MRRAPRRRTIDRAPFPALSKATRAGFLALFPPRDPRSDRLAYVLDDPEFARLTKHDEVLAVLREASSSAYYLRRGIDETKSSREEFLAWKKARHVEYRLLKRACDALLRLWERRREGRGAWVVESTATRLKPGHAVLRVVGRSEARRVVAGHGHVLVHAQRFLSDAIREYPALALDFPLFPGVRPTRLENRSPFAPVLRLAKRRLRTCGVSAELTTALLRAIGLLR